MLLPLKPGELQRLIPAVASGPQFSFCSGGPQLVLQRLLVSTLGGVIPLLISQGGLWLPLEQPLARDWFNDAALFPVGTDPPSRQSQFPAAQISSSGFI